MVNTKKSDNNMMSLYEILEGSKLYTPDYT